MNIQLYFTWMVQALAVGTFIIFLLAVFFPKFFKQKQIKNSFFKNKQAIIQFSIFTFFYSINFLHLFWFNKEYSVIEVFIVGAVLAIVGLVLACSGRYQLRKVWSPVTNTVKSEVIIKTGVFRLTRHPIYTGRILFFAGVMLMFNWPLVFLTILYWYFLQSKAKQEETALQESGSEYGEYMDDVKRRF